jgi:hypothetical protein
MYIRRRRKWTIQEGVKKSTVGQTSGGERGLLQIRVRKGSLQISRRER